MVKILKFSSKSRLRKSPEFKLVRQHGERAYSRFTTIYRLRVEDSVCKENRFSKLYLEKKSLDNYSENNIDCINFLAKLGITVSKKVHKRAVVRNRIKRYIREVFRSRVFPVYDNSCSDFNDPVLARLYFKINKQHEGFTDCYSVIARSRAVECLNYFEMEQDILNALKFF